MQSMRSRRIKWLFQLIRAYQRGIDDRKAGKPRVDCPYLIGKGLQQQRRREWYKGYDSKE